MQRTHGPERAISSLMNKFRQTALEFVIFFAGRALDALSLIALLWLASTFSSPTLVLGDLAADLGGLYLIVRGYFILLGYLALSAVVFVAMECVGGLRTRNRLMTLNVGVPLLHGLIFGILLRTATTAYWAVGAGMLLVAASATWWVWWPWLARRSGYAS